MRVKFVADIGSWWTHNVEDYTVRAFWNYGSFANEPMKFLRAFLKAMQ